MAISGGDTSYSVSFSEGSIDIVSVSGTTNTYNVSTACAGNRTGTSENDGSVVLNTTGVDSDNSVVYGQAFTDSSFTAATDFGCGLSDGVEWVRSYPKNKEGFFVEITSSPISENY